MYTYIHLYIYILEEILLGSQCYSVGIPVVVSEVSLLRTHHRSGLRRRRPSAGGSHQGRQRAPWSWIRVEPIHGRDQDVY